MIPSKRSIFGTPVLKKSVYMYMCFEWYMSMHHVNTLFLWRPKGASDFPELEL